MNLIIFEQEKLDGLESAIAELSSVSFERPARQVKEPVCDIPSHVSVAKEGDVAKGLLSLDTVLVSTGWNKNDDVFLPDRTWAARNTPVNKPFNFMHRESDIIGHITGSYVVDLQGAIATEAPPSTFDIVTESVIYRDWRGAENQERIDNIIAEIAEDKWFVSMEARFPSFDYALISPDGQESILERNANSAYLTKHLRVYGGTGMYKGYKVGRALDDMTFSGKGLVKRPGNDRSVILRSSAFDKYSEITDDPIGDKKMSDVYEKQVAELKSELAKRDAEVKAIAEKQAKEQAEAQEKLVKDLASRDEAFAKLSEQLKAKEATIAEQAEELGKIQSDLTAKAELLEKAEAEALAAKAEQVKLARTALLVDAGFTEAEAQSKVAIYGPLSDEAFSQVAADMKEMKKYGKDEDKDEDDAKGKKSAKADAEPEANAEVLDGATAEATPSPADDDDADEMASMASFIESTIVKSK